MDDAQNLRLLARLAARLHDPPEKALVLLRSKQGHEGGTVRALLNEIFEQGLPAAVQEACQKADRWASAADRMAFPHHQSDGRYPPWQQVNFAQQPVLIHPLTSQEHRLEPLDDDVQAAHAQALGTDHYRRYVLSGDYRNTALALWRFGPMLDGRLSELWKLLPADSRVPDHTIHDHLDLTSALASCLVDPNDGGPALLAVSLGPVQDFIAAGRSVSDLWAGSHLLSHLAWVAMRVVCEALGPEAVLFPRLRAVPAVDLWLVRDQGLPVEWFDSLAWRKLSTDANPLFAAALPNRFTAIVPAAHAQHLAQRITRAVRDEALRLTREAFAKLLSLAGMSDDPSLYGYQQIQRQLEGFPEVHWAMVPWSLAATGTDGKVLASDEELARAMQPFFLQKPPGFLGSQTWQCLSGGYPLEEGRFFQPNPGALYPALHELLERVLASAKTTRTFEATHERGWRCSLTGEAEWISTHAQHLTLPPGQRTDTVWARAAQVKGGRLGIRPGEHLSALPMLKRLWPTLFIEQVRSHIDTEQLVRYVVSTHTMAVASAIDRAVRQGIAPPEDMRGDKVALPAKLAVQLRSPNMKDWAYVPGWLEERAEQEEHSEDANGKRRGEEGRSPRSKLQDLLGEAPDAYYGLLLMDGDNMGAWLSSSAAHTPKVAESFHPQLRNRLTGKFGVDAQFIRYAQSSRAANPAWHMAISQALNHFALELVPEIIERNHLGKLIYAGGDDVLAMLCTRDLMSAAAQLRAAYSGVDPASIGAKPEDHGLWQRSGNGWVQSKGQLLRLMGDKATASVGMVVAHHQAPLASVHRALRQAEKSAKSLDGKNAWSLSILKRGGGALYVTARWGEPLRLFEDLRTFLGKPGVSRRAAYHVTQWMHDVPKTESGLVRSLLGYQMARQVRGLQLQSQAAELAQRLVSLAYDDRERPRDKQPLDWLLHFMLAAEFLARDERHHVVAHTPNEGAQG